MKAVSFFQGIDMVPHLVFHGAFQHIDKFFALVLKSDAIMAFPGFHHDSEGFQMFVLGIGGQGGIGIMIGPLGIGLGSFFQASSCSFKRKPESI